MIYLFSLLLLLPAEPSISVRLDRANCFEPCSLSVAVSVSGYAVDRSLCVAVYDRSSRMDPIWQTCRPYSGRKITDIPIKDVWAGEYDVIASLPEAEFRSATAPLNVISTRHQGR